MENITVEKIEEAIRNGLQNHAPGVSSGAGRAYVSMSKVERPILEMYKKAAKKLGVRYLTEAYGAGKRCLYIGYDNFTGVPIAQARAIAENLKKLGLPVYDEAVAD
jgi:hypothetical protein